jgi:uncharacterized SAM-binding protein YcdF (DUF218 family)
MAGSISAQPDVDAIVVLGSPVLEGGVLGAAAERRVGRAAHAFHAGGVSLVVASGGRRWHGVAEADAFCQRLVSLGVPKAVIVRELCSLSTLENAAYCAEILRANGSKHPAIVTCAWHAPRALACFRWLGWDATAFVAESSVRSVSGALARRAAEQVRWLMDRRAAHEWMDR